MPNHTAVRILVVRLSHIGDCVLTLPMVSALRDSLEAHITWLVESPTDQLLRGHDAVDDLIVVRRGWSKRMSKIHELGKRLRARTFDLTIDPQSLTKSALPAWLSRTRQRIGFARPQGREIAPLLNNHLVPATKTHLVDRSLELAAVAGAETDTCRFDLPHDLIARNAVRDFLATHHLGCDFAVLNVGAGWPSKKWPPRCFGRVARHLGHGHQIPTVVTWAGEAERQDAEEIVSKSGGHAVMAPATSLLQLVALARAAKFFVGSDTGPLHIAAAADCPCVGLYGPTDPAKCGPYGDHHVVVTPPHWQELPGKARRLDCGPIQSISAESVLEACEQMLVGLIRRAA